MPQIRFDSLDQVPEGLQEFAKKVDGDDSAVTVGVVAETKLAEFRDNNIALSKQRDDLSTKIENLQSIVGENPDEFSEELSELRQMAERVKAGELKESRAVEEAVGKRTEEMRKSYEERGQKVSQELAAWKQRYEGLDKKFREERVKNAIRAASFDPDGAPDKLGIHQGAVDDIIERGLRIFKVDGDGKIIPQDGEATIYGADGITPMTPREWLGKLREDAPYYFQGTSGGGAGGDKVKTVIGDKTREDLKGMTASERLELANNPPQERRG